MKTALVTGAAGFVGRHLVPKLEAAGYRVTKIDKKYGPMSLAEEIPEWPRFDVIVHLAANIPDVNERMKGGPRQYEDISLDIAVAKYVASHPPNDCFVWPTSCAIDYAPDPYAFCKIAGERIFGSLVQQGVKVKMLRPFSGYGEDQALSYPFPAIVDRAVKRENPLTVWGSGLQVRDFIHIDDLTDAFMLATKDTWPVGLPVDIGTGIGTNFLDLAEMIADEVGYDPVILPLEEKAESSARRVANTSVADRLGFWPKVSLREGIRRAVAARLTCTH